MDTVHDIFISYSHKDQAWVSKLAERLEARGYNVWWDKELLASQDYAAIIEDALNSTQCILTVWSSHSVKSKWVRAESNRGFKQDKMVPVLIDDANIPIPFDSLHAADLRDWQWDENDKAFVKLLSALDWILQREKLTPAPQAFAAIPPSLPISPRPTFAKSSIGWAFGIGALTVAIGAGYFVNNYLDTSTSTPFVSETPVKVEATPSQQLALKKCKVSNSENSIIQASGRGRMKRVSDCLSLGVDVNITDENGWTALHAAAAKGNLDIARKLIATGNARIDAKDNNKMTPVYLAVYETVKPNTPPVQIKRLKDMIVYLKDSGASMSVSDKNGQNLISRAKGNPQLLQLITN